MVMSSSTFKLGILSSMFFFVVCFFYVSPFKRSTFFSSFKFSFMVLVCLGKILRGKKTLKQSPVSFSAQRRMSHVGNHIAYVMCAEFYMINRWAVNR